MSDHEHPAGGFVYSSQLADPGLNYDYSATYLDAEYHLEEAPRLMDSRCLSMTRETRHYSDSPPPHSFARTLLDEDEEFYAIFPDARPSSSTRPFSGHHWYTYSPDSAYTSFQSEIRPLTGSYNSPGCSTQLSGALDERIAFAKSPVVPAFQGPGTGVDTTDSTHSNDIAGSLSRHRSGGSTSNTAHSSTLSAFTSSRATPTIYPDITAPAKDDDSSHQFLSSRKPLRVSIADNVPAQMPTARQVASGSTPTLTSIGARQGQDVYFLDSPATTSPPVSASSPDSQVSYGRHHSPELDTDHAHDQPATSTSSPVKLRRAGVIACNFCRVRKIACGPGSNADHDRTCNQCERRQQECVYPLENRRGKRSKKDEDEVKPPKAKARSRSTKRASLSS